MMQPERDLSGFTGAGYDVGRSKWVQALWLIVQTTVFMRWWLPATMRVALLRAFGASVGKNVLIRHRVRIHWPWKLAIGDNTWIGEGAWLLNLEPIRIGRSVCISQEALLCTGSHDRRSPTFEFDTAEIAIGNGSWVAARAIVLRGVSIGPGATVGAGVVVWRDIAEGARIVGAAGS
jgi:putative colanic acid biosynthesis acetyltransferase WcaF